MRRLVPVSTSSLPQPRVDAAIAAAAPCRCRRRCRSPDVVVDAATPCRRPHDRSPVSTSSCSQPRVNRDLDFVLANLPALNGMGEFRGFRKFR